MTVALILTLGFGVLLYIISFRKAEFQRLQHLSFPSSEAIIRELRSSFTGYALCLDFVRNDTSIRMIKEIQEYMKQAAIPLLVFDAASVIPEIPEVGERLQIEYLPALVKVQAGRAAKEGIFLPPMNRSWGHLLPDIQGPQISESE